MSKILRCSLFFIVWFVSLAPVRAQILPDEASIEAMIGNHRMVKTALDVRLITEIALVKAHKTTALNVTDYKAVNDTLDKYQRSFDILNTILSGASTALKTVNTVKRSKQNIEGILNLIADYQMNFLLKGDVEVADTIILNTCYRCVLDTKDAVNSLWKSYAAIGSYFTGVTECKTSNLMATFESMNESLDNLDRVLSHAYGRLWYYMLMRSHYFKGELFTSINVKQIVEGAYGTWMQSAQDVGQDIRSRQHTSRGTHLGGGGLLGERRRNNF